MISINELEKILKKTDKIHFIISNKENLNNIPNITKYNNNIMILKTEEIACQLKYKNTDLYILLTDECPLHPFKLAYKIKNTSLNKILNSPYEIIEEEIKIFSKEIIINTKNELIYNYFYYHNNIEPKFNLINKTKFLISRLSKIEKSKEKKIFGIFFSSIYYEKMANKIIKFLISINKKAYKYFLRDINESRLNCFDGIECIVVIDCPFKLKFTNFHIPMLIPFEIQMAFGDWNGEYFINKFDLINLSKTINIENKLAKIEYSTGKLIKFNQKQSVQYHTNEPPEILKGLKGIASEYESEIQLQRMNNFLIKLESTSDIELKAVLNLSNEKYTITNIYDRFYIINCSIETIDLISIRCFSVINIELIIKEEKINNLKNEHLNFLKNFKIYCNKNNIKYSDENMKKYDKEIKHFCKCYWNNSIINPIIELSNLKINYFKKYPNMKYLNGTKVFENFLIENIKLIENNNSCKSEGIKFLIPNIKNIPEKDKLFEKYEFLLKHSPKKINPDKQYNVYLSLNLITKTFRISNRSFFFKHEIKKQKFIGKTSMPIPNGILAINLLGLYKNIVYDPCCGSGSLLFMSSLFGCLVSGTDLQKKQLIGFNETTSNVRTSLKGFNILTNFKQFNTFDKVLFFGIKDIFKNDIKLNCEYIFTDLPYGVRSMKTKDIDEYMKKLKYLYDQSSVKGICFWMEAGYNVENIFGLSIFKIQENLKTCQRILYIFKK